MGGQVTSTGMLIDDQVAALIKRMFIPLSVSNKTVAQFGHTAQNGVLLVSAGGKLLYKFDGVRGVRSESTLWELKGFFKKHSGYHPDPMYKTMKEKLESDPNNYEAHRELAQYYLDIAEYKSAVTHWKEARRLAASPQDKVQMEYLLGVTLRRSGDLDEAEEAFKKMEQEGKADPAEYRDNLLAERAWIRLYRHEFKEVTEMLEDAVEDFIKSKRLGEMYYLMAVAYFNLDKLGKAKKYFLEGEELDPGSLWSAKGRRTKNLLSFGSQEWLKVVHPKEFWQSKD